MQGNRFRRPWQSNSFYAAAAIVFEGSCPIHCHTFSICYRIVCVFMKERKGFLYLSLPFRFPTQHLLLQAWPFLEAETSLSKGEHCSSLLSGPVYMLFEGRLPGSLKCSLPQHSQHTRVKFSSSAIQALIFTGRF